MVIWITGLSAAGKTTLCNALRDLVKARLPELVILDGEAMRAVFGHDGNSEADRVTRVKWLQSIARVLADQGLLVVVGVLYAHPDLLAWNRANLSGYFEVYLKASMATLRARDPKGLYQAAEAGRMREVVGLDIPWHPPETPDMVVDMDAGEAPEVIARRLALRIPRLAAALAPAERRAATAS